VNTAFGPFVWQISAGWLRCFSILGKFIVTMLALIALVSTTRFADLLTAMQKLAVPKLLIIQLGFLYRYIFVLIDRAHQIMRARAGRKLRNLGFKAELKTASSMLGSLFIRSIDTAEHINIAMQARGFDGNWRSLSQLQFRRGDLLFILVSATFVLVLYYFIGNILQ
jgi:cobalt/nickel transport system permease protein